jgi:hypothetical protein
MPGKGGEFRQQFLPALDSAVGATATLSECFMATVSREKIAPLRVYVQQRFRL